MENISTVAVETVYEEVKRNEWQEGSFDDFCCGIVLLEELVKPV